MILTRPATADDKASIAEFTTNTFEWGDYVLDRFDEWIDDPAGHLLVAVVDEAPVGLARATMLSDTELWLHAARVHPGHRGRGIGGVLNDALVAWGKDQGAQVARLAVEDWNEPAQRQVAKAGYRPVSRWVRAHRRFEADDPNPTRNGGKRVPGPERLSPAPRAEAEPAFLAWSTSDLMRAGRGLFGRRWMWRRLTIDDLVAGPAEFYQCPSGWALIDRDAEGSTVEWLMATPGDVPRLVRAILDQALDGGDAALSFFAPAVDDVTASLERIGCDLSPLTIWAKAL